MSFFLNLSNGWREHNKTKNPSSRFHARKGFPFQKKSDVSHLISFVSKIVESQGVEPWSREGNCQAFYMLSCTLGFRVWEGRQQTQSAPYLLNFASRSEFPAR